MNQFEPAAADHLREIGASCPRLLYALHDSPEAGWGEIMRVEAACHSLQQDCPGCHDASEELLTHVEALRTHLAKAGWSSYDAFAAFRESVAALRQCVASWQTVLEATISMSVHSLKACIFYCSNNVDPRHWGVLGDETDSVKTIALPCSGKVDVPYLVKALETGAEAVVVVACRKQECRHFEGSPRAHKRAEAVESLLKEIGLPGGRIAVVECAPGGAGRAGEQINEFFEHTRNQAQGPAATGALNPPQHMVA